MCITHTLRSITGFDLISPAINLNLRHDPCSLTIHFLRSTMIAQAACSLHSVSFASAKEILGKKSLEWSHGILYLAGFCLNSSITRSTYWGQLLGTAGVTDPSCLVFTNIRFIAWNFIESALLCASSSTLIPLGHSFTSAFFFFECICDNENVKFYTSMYTLMIH